MLTLKCPRHPRYNGKESPRASCQQCLFIYHARRDAAINRVQTERSEEGKTKVSTF